MATLLLVRHGETDWNRENRFQGHADPPLNEAGREQARELATRLAGEPLSAVFTSPLRRARETAEVVAAERGLHALPEPGLLEIDVGSWSGLTRTEVEQRFPDGYRRWLDLASGWDDGETYEVLAERVVRTLLRIAAAHDGEPVLLVTHSGPIRAAVAAADGIPYAEARRAVRAIGNCSVFRLAVEGRDLRRIN
jgi:ribonuclease H / adenosylcobalamin/alpha-ribazole phosphatase